MGSKDTQAVHGAAIGAALAAALLATSAQSADASSSFTLDYQRNYTRAASTIAYTSWGNNRFQNTDDTDDSNTLFANPSQSASVDHERYSNGARGIASSTNTSSVTLTQDTVSINATISSSASASHTVSSGRYVNASVNAFSDYRFTLTDWFELDLSMLITEGGSAYLRRYEGDFAMILQLNNSMLEGGLEDVLLEPGSYQLYVSAGAYAYASYNDDTGQPASASQTRSAQANFLLTYVPAPGAAMTLLAAGLAAGSRRRR